MSIDIQEFESYINSFINLIDTTIPARVELLIEANSQVEKRITSIHEQLDHDGHSMDIVNQFIAAGAAKLGIGAGIIIAVGSWMHEALAAINDKASQLPQGDAALLSDYDATQLGPEISNGIKWAKAVRVGGNYVRHSSEWISKFDEYRRTENCSFDDAVNQFEQSPGCVIKDNRAMGSIEPLIALGVRTQDIFDGRARSYDEVATRLNLFDVDETVIAASSWVRDIKQRYL